MPVWATRDRAEAAEAEVARLKAAADDERAWWVLRYAAAHVSGPVGAEASRQMSRRANEWAKAHPDRMKEPF